MSDKKWKVDLSREDVKTIITILSLLILFTGLRLYDVLSIFNQTFFPKPLDIIESVKNPEIFQWSTSYDISDAYYIEQKIVLPTSDIVFDNDLKFRIKIIDHGKKEVEEPRIAIFIMDSFLRTWGVWSKNLTKQQCEKPIILKYEFPSQDKKNIGSWRIVSLLYDDKVNVLVSYNNSMFMVEEPSYVYYIIAAIMLIAISFVLINEYNARKKKHKKDTKGENKG